MPKRAAADDVTALELSPPPLEGVDELSAQVFRAFHAALRDAVVGGEQTQADSLAGVGAVRRQCPHHQLLVETQRDLADALHLARPTVSKMLQAMEKAGVVERRPDETDQRLTCVKLTASGRILEQDLRAVAADYVNETIGTLPEGDRRELARLLQDLAASISRATAAL
jgi:DNA-binding MarR family transcriptional regulator